MFKKIAFIVFVLLVYQGCDSSSLGKKYSYDGLTTSFNQNTDLQNFSVCPKMASESIDLQSSQTLERLQDFYAKYVNQNGEILYKSILASPNDRLFLCSYLESTNNLNLSNLNVNAQKAILVNTYNLAIINYVVSNYKLTLGLLNDVLPNQQSILNTVPLSFDAQDLPITAYSKKTQNIFSGLYSLDEIITVFIKPLNDYRMYFGLSDGTRKSTRILAEPLSEENFSQQINLVIQSYISDNELNQFDNSDQSFPFLIISGYFKRILEINSENAADFSGRLLKIYSEMITDEKLQELQISRESFLQKNVDDTWLWTIDYNNYDYSLNEAL